MRRKVIQIAESTQLISLPRKWALKYGIKKGEELNVEEKGSQLIISSEKGTVSKKIDLNIDNLSPMVLRYVVALYKKGVDEINISFDNPNKIKVVQEAIGKEAVGFEITEQSNRGCTIKHVSGELEEFDSILKRTFLLLVSMSEQILIALKNKKYAELENAAFMEEANNRFTTSCRRLLNKKGAVNDQLIGPLYYIIEELENIADQYKYLCQYFFNKQSKEIKIKQESLELLDKTNEMIKKFSEVFFKYDEGKIVELGKCRKELIPKALSLFEKSKSIHDTTLLHYNLTILQKTFCLIGPLLVIKL